MTTHIIKLMAATVSIAAFIVMVNLIEGCKGTNTPHPTPLVGK